MTRVMTMIFFFNSVLRPFQDFSAHMRDANQ